jgi:hypothetical protein
VSALDPAPLLEAEALGREGALPADPSTERAGGGGALPQPHELAHRLGLAARVLALAQGAATDADPWTADAFAMAELAIRLDAARALTFAIDPAGELSHACAAAAVHEALAEAAAGAPALLSSPAADDVAAALAAVQHVLAADPRGGAALEAVAAGLIDRGDSLLELP